MILFIINLLIILALILVIINLHKSHSGLEHFVNNTEHVRYNFQICFAEPIEEVYECLTHI